VTHIVWDWNGTLVDDLTLVVAATNASLASVGAGPVTADEHRRDFRRPVDAYYAGVLGRRLDPDDFRALDRVFQEAYTAGLETCALTVDALTCLRGWTGTQSLLSMWFHDQLVPTVDRYQLTRYFTRVDGLRSMVGGGPKEPHLREHLDALGLAAADCVLIGDSVDDAEAAASIGARCLLYSGGFTHRDRLVEVGVPVVDSLSEAVALAAAFEAEVAQPRR
jgi:phosphoglycolate phosphatase-like HAD superfamily hydrolase